MSATHILPMRFRIRNDAPVAQVKVQTFDYPYHAIKSVQSAVQKEANITRFKNHQYPPLAQLGTVFNLLIPGLIHPFFFDKHSWRTQPLMSLSEDNQKDENQQTQPILALSGLHQKQPLSKRKIHEVIGQWIYLWLQRRDFKLSDHQVNKLYSDFIENLKNTQSTWVEQDISKYLIYRAIPSLVASLMVQHSADQKSSLELEGQPIRWYLAQSYDHLHLVSNVKEGPRDSAFSYKVDFSLQDHAGSEEKWLHIYLHVQRYADAKPDYPVNLNFRRGARILLKKAQPYPDWGNAQFVPNTFVPLWVDQKKSGWKYRYGPQVLMDELSIVDAVIDPNLIRKNPVRYRDVDEKNDQYRVVYSEGMNPNHGMETGASMEARRQIMAMFANTLEEWLEPANPLPKDKNSELRNLRALREHSFIAKRAHIRKHNRDFESEKIDEQKLGEILQDIYQSTYQTLTDSFLRALNLESDMRAVVILCWHRPQTVEKVREKIRRLFNTDIIGIDPEAIEFIPIQIDKNRLISRLGITEKDAEKREKQRLFELRKRKKEWENWITEQLEANEINQSMIPTFALVELPGSDENIPDEELSMKSSIRAAFSSKNIPSQMFAPIPNGEAYSDTDDNRLIASVSDLLLRQAGVTFTDARAFHGNIQGKKTDFSNRLIVTSLYRLRQRGNNPVDYSIAVRWLPDGRVQACTPHTSWDEYWKVIPQIGIKFYDAQQKGGKKDYKLGNEELVQFCKEVILSQSNDRPHLVTLSADDWRSAIQSLTNPMMELDALQLGDQTLTTQDNPNLFIVRLRFHQPIGETPQYVALKGESWRVDTVDDEEEIIDDSLADGIEVNQVRGTYTSGFIDYTIDSPFFHYASIGKVPITVSSDQYKFNSIDEQHGRGGRIAFKHQTIVEIVPFFSSNHSIDHVMALTIGAMRSIPSWQQGHILLPYLMHLGKQALLDQADVLDISVSETTEEDDE